MKKTPATDAPANSPSDSSAALLADRSARWLWTVVALVYVLLAAYTAWFSVDKDIVQGGTWFALGVCFFCIGLIPMRAPANARREVSSSRED